jgi:hypothetical protein
LILFCLFIFHFDCLWSQGPSWPWSYGSWIYNYLCNQCLSPLMLWVRISIRVRCTTLCDKVCQWLATGQRFSPGPPGPSTNKTDRHDITEILLKVHDIKYQQTIHVREYDMDDHYLEMSTTLNLFHYIHNPYRLRVN